MKLTKYVAIIKIGEENIIHNSNKTKDIDEWVKLSTDKSKGIDAIEIYERNGFSYTITYKACNRKVGF